MTVKSSPSRDTRHSIWVIAFHWMTAALILTGIAIVFSRELVEDPDLRRSMLGAHVAIGSSILLMTLARFIGRLRHSRIRKPHDLPWLTRAAAALTHTALYGLLIALPLLGWAQQNARGKTVALAGLIPLPPLVGRDRDLADQLLDYHVTAAWALMAIVGLHVVAALWHHFVRRDAVLTSILPTGESYGVATLKSDDPA